MSLLRGAYLGLAECLYLLPVEASLVLRDALDLPGPEALLACGESEDYLANLVRQACAGRVDPQVLLEQPGSAHVRPATARELAALRSRHSTSGATTARRR